MPLNKLNLFNNSNISKSEFLKEYWHKKPILLKSAISQKELNVFPDKKQIMQLSCDEDIQSRVVFKQSKDQYDIEIGPFVSADLTNFKDYCWNLLVSDIDKWQPKSREILKYFDFIRNWTFDDIMLSTGSIGGTVGPHTDRYDVFLLQVHGNRKWSYGLKKTYNPELIPDQKIKIMKDFKADTSYELKAGDVLYLPPEISHQGVVTTESCVTCSIGVRTPSHAELLTSFTDTLSQSLSENHRFEEPQFKQQPNSGELTEQDISAVADILNKNLDTKQLNNWFGKFITEYRSIFYEFNQHQNSQELKTNPALILSPFSKSCYFAKDDKANLFVNGHQFNSSLIFAQMLCDDKFISSKALLKLNTNDKTIIKKIFENGSVLINS